MILVQLLKSVDAMDNLKQITFKSIMTYFKALSLYGFKSHSDVEKLFALLFIKNFIGYFMGMFTQKDTTMFEKAIIGLTNSTCLIENVLTQKDYYSYLYNVYSSASIRVTEDFVARMAEEQGTRVVE